MKIKRIIKKINLRFPIYVVRTLEKFYLDACSYHAATLTFYTLFALVPFLGLMFGVAQSFGFEDSLKTAFASILEGQDQIYTNLLVFSENLLSQTKEAIIAGVGLAILLWSVFKVIRVLDYVFNKVWGVEFQQSTFYRLHQFAALLILLPILLVIVGGALLSSFQAMSSILPQTLQLSWLTQTPSQTKIISILLFTCLMGFSYWGIPSVKIPLRSALLSGLIASLLFHLMQYGYLTFQKEINEFGIVYGSFASVPLFMMWIYLSWFIYLVGAELTYILESRITRSWELKVEEMPHHIKQALSLEVMHLIMVRFEKGEKPIGSIEIANQLSIPLTLSRFLLDRLISAELVNIAGTTIKRQTGYVPAKSVSIMSDAYILHELNNRSSSGKVHRYGSIIEELMQKYRY